MIKDLSLETFLDRNRISQETWDLAKIEWSVLQSIACKHESDYPSLETSAEFFGKALQKISCVHSVRWRVKDAEHLAEKIVRKRSVASEKYMGISVENYHEIVTDLIGIRALHLFKDDCFEIDNAIKAHWTPIEESVAYAREGDSANMRSRLEENGFIVKDHPAGYRSIHYVISSKPFLKEIIAEIQVRTIFEEGWSEIDHRIRYPNYTDNSLVIYFLEIFNRMAGSADDMGGFVLGLVASLNKFEKEIITKNQENKEILNEVEKAVLQLEGERKESAEYKDNLQKLKIELSKLKDSKNPSTSTKNVFPTSGGFLNSLNLFDEIKKGYFGLNSLREHEEIKNALDSMNTINIAKEAQKGLLGLNFLKEQELMAKTLDDMRMLNFATEAQKGLLNSTYLNLPEKKIDD